VAMLLGAYDVVIRVEADEMLVVDPRVAPSLRAYIEGTSRPYYTARGFDVIQTTGETPLVPGPILAQRRHAYPNTALNKTAIVRTPLHWNPGFHWCSAYPECDALFMLHLKRADIDQQLAWFSDMTAKIADNPAVPAATREYYRPDRAKIALYHNEVSTRPRLCGIESWYREAVQANYFRSISYSPKEDIYGGEFAHDHVLCEIPASWKNLF